MILKVNAIQSQGHKGQGMSLDSEKFSDIVEINQSLLYISYLKF